MQKWLENLKGPKKDQILILFLLGILLLVIAIPSGETEQVPETEESIVYAVTDEVQLLEEKLKRILSHVEGIGNVEVMLTLKSDGKKIVEKDLEYSEDKEENDQEGVQSASGTVSERENTVFEKDAQGNEVPYVSEELSPEIEGVLVIAQGAGNSSVAAEITEAVMALFGVEAHKIKVMKMQ